MKCRLCSSKARPSMPLGYEGICGECYVRRPRDMRLTRMAVAADADDHLDARNTLPCPICGAAVCEDCTFGLPHGQPAKFEGKVHTRRVTRWLESLPVDHWRFTNPA